MNTSQKQLFFYPSIKAEQLPHAMREELLAIYQEKGQIIDAIVRSQDSMPTYRRNRRTFLENLIWFFIEHAHASRYLARHQEFNFYAYLMLGLKLLYGDEPRVSFSKTKGGGVGVLGVIRYSIERWKMLNSEHYARLSAEENSLPRIDFSDFANLHQQYSFELNNILYLFTPEYYAQSNVRMNTEYKERMYYLIGILKDYSNLDDLYPNPYEQIYDIKEKIQDCCESVCPEFNVAGGAKNAIKMLLYAYNQFDDSIPLYEPRDYHGRGRFQNQKRLEQQLLEVQLSWQQMINKLSSLEQEIRELKQIVSQKYPQQG